MTLVLAVVVSCVFLVLGLWHVSVALSPSPGSGGASSAVPSVNGKPLFVPSTRATLAVAAGLILFAALVLATAGILTTGVPGTVLVWLSYALAAGLLARAVGEFKYVGFFKKFRGSHFAKMDTLVYSPLCVLLALGVSTVALMQGAK